MNACKELLIKEYKCNLEQFITNDKLRTWYLDYFKINENNFTCVWAVKNGYLKSLEYINNKLSNHWTIKTIESSSAEFND